MHDPEKLKLELCKWLDIDQAIRSVWEFGSRDRQFACQLKRVFPSAEIHLIEPNPDMYVEVSQAASQIERAQAHNLPSGSKVRIAKFNALDGAREVTPWVGGNRRALSFPKHNKLSKHAKYTQTPVELRIETAESFWHLEDLASPDLLWLDVPGCEWHVSRGLGPKIKDAVAIFVALSLEENYEGQTLIPDFLKVVNRDFHWVAVINSGRTKVHCVFVSKRHQTLKMKVISRLLTLSLGTGLRVGIENRSSRQILGGVLRSPAVVLYRYVASRSWGSATASLVLKYLPARLKSVRVASELRRIVDRSLPVDPLRGPQSLPMLEAVIPCVKKDLSSVMACVKSLKSNSHNEISKVTLVVPSAELSDFEFLDGEVTVCSEDSVIPGRVLDAIADFPAARRGWLTQQIIKLLVVRESQAAGVLVLDADTVLTQPRVWLDSQGRQSLAISQEFHEPYIRHYSRVFQARGHIDGLSFVTHHQLMQPPIVREMFPTLERVVDWICAITDFASGASEYHDYGTFLMSRYPHRAALSRWENLSATPLKSAAEISKFAEWVSKTKPETMSVSFHSYNGAS